MDTHHAQCPLTKAKILDRYFLEHRAKLIDIAAFLDRVERATPVDHSAGQEDFRLAALREALAILSDRLPDHTKRILERLSDPTTAPSTGTAAQPAIGAYCKPTDHRTGSHGNCP